MTSNGKIRALLLTYVFPPTGGVGSERVRKLAKYLPEHDVEPIVLTALNPSVPLVDSSIVRDVPAGLRVLRARTLEPGYSVKQAAWATSSAGTNGARPSLATRARGALALLGRSALVPDPQILWQPDVHRLLIRELFRREPAADVVFITAPPFSAFLSAPISRLRRGTGVVLDYRDEWQTTRSSYEMIGGRVASTIGAVLEDALLRCAHVVTTATEAFRENLLSRFRFLDPARVVAITNGYDPDDFPPALPEPPSDRFVITYAGTVYKLTSPRGFLAGVKILHEREPELARFLDVKFIGRIVDTERDAFEGTDALGVRCLGFLEKDRVAAEQGAGHMALCLQDSLPGNERIYQAKIFELMYLGRPVLTLAPAGALKDLVDRHRLGPVLPPRDAPAIAAFLADTLHAWREGRFRSRTEATGIERYHRRALAGDFAQVFRAAVARAVVRGGGSVIGRGIRVVRSKNLHTWLGGWARHLIRDASTPRPTGPRHLLFALCDHFEPKWLQAPPAQALERVRTWEREYPPLASRFRDADGRPPQHSFFFPAEEYEPPYLDALAELARAGYGEVELHLHHDGDDAGSLRRTIREAVLLLAGHGHLSRDPEGRPRYAFIHGNWALANSRADGRLCGVDEELPLLWETGCYADFTFPAAPDECQPRVVNQIYWPVGDLTRRRAYEHGERARVGAPRRDRILMITGPLTLYLRRTALPIGIEASDLTGRFPPTAERVRRWAAQNIHVAGRPEWVFVKAHTHGAQERNSSSLLGAGGAALHQALATRYNDGRSWSLHYLSAREMYNVAMAAIDGKSGNPNAYRDYLLPPPPARGV
jgi:glycosyltransferase involved in cell wall biosynthesis